MPVIRKTCLALAVIGIFSEAARVYEIAEPNFKFVRAELTGKMARVLVEVANGNAYGFEQLRLTCQLLLANGRRYVDEPTQWVQHVGPKGSETAWLETWAT